MRMKTKTKKDKVKCPWCGRLIAFSKGDTVEPHVGPGGVKCVGVGQPKHLVLPLRNQIGGLTVNAKSERRKTMNREDLFNLLLQAGIVKQVGIQGDRQMLYEVDDSHLTEYGRYCLREAASPDKEDNEE